MKKQDNIKMSETAVKVVANYNKLLKGKMTVNQRNTIELLLGLNLERVMSSVIAPFKLTEVMESSDLTEKVSHQLSWVKTRSIDARYKALDIKYLSKQAISFFEACDLFITKMERKQAADGSWHTVKEYSIDDNKVVAHVRELFDIEPVEADKRCKRTLYSPGKRLSRSVRDFLNIYGKQELKLVELDIDTLEKFIMVRKDYIRDSKNESKDMKYNRFMNYAEELAPYYGQKLYHHLSLENRGRARIIRNTNPLTDWFGEENQNAMWELYNSENLTDTGLEELKWSAVILMGGKHKRSSFKMAIKYYDKHHGEVLANLEKGADTTLYTLRLAKILKGGIGKLTGFLHGVDATNGGQSHMGMSFKSADFLKSANFQGLMTPQDSHAEITDTFNGLYGVVAPRAKVKKKNQEKEHGSTTKSVLMKIGGDFPGLNDLYNSLGSEVELTIQETDKVFRDKLGKCYNNIETIASYGVELASASKFLVDWRLPDGMIATHQSYVQSDTVNVVALSPDGYRESVTITCDLPLDVVGGKIQMPPKDSKAQNKIRGLLANITHSIDAYVARESIRRASDKGFVVLYKHDKFFTHPNYTREFRKIYGEVMVDTYDMDLFGSALLDIERNTGIKAPRLIYGDATKKSLLKDTNGLQPYLIA